MITNNARFLQTKEAQPPGRLTETISAAANRIYHDALVPAAAVQADGPKMPDSLCGYYFLPPTKAKSGGRAPYDVAAVHRDFPILARKVNGHPLIWLDKDRKSVV